VVDGLDLAHLDEPFLDVLGRGDQHAMTVILRLTQHLNVITQQCTSVCKQEGLATVGEVNFR